MPFLDLTQDQRSTTGDVPPPSVGSTVTVVGRRLFVVAGRLVSSRSLTTDIYALDLETLVWSKVAVEGPTQPAPRYFHSANAHGSSIVIFGGMSSPSTAGEGEGLSVLDDVAVFDTVARRWTLATGATVAGQGLRPRYAHLSAVSGDRLVVVGGQDVDNGYLEDAAVFDLTRLAWGGTSPIAGQCGAYRSLLVAADPDNGRGTATATDPYPTDVFAELKLADEADVVTSVSPVSSRSSWGQAQVPAQAAAALAASARSPAAGLNNDLATARRPSLQVAGGTNPLGLPQQSRPGPLGKTVSSSSSSSERGFLADQQQRQQPPARSLFLYSNFNFTDVERQLYRIEPPGAEGIRMHDETGSIVTDVLPPGLRFPSGTVVGDHLVISGTYLTNASQVFAIWALDLVTRRWRRIELSESVRAGSWNRALYCPELERYVVLGHRDRSLVEDYNHRRVNYDHVTIVDLEVHGVFEPVGPSMSPLARELGIMTMADTAFCDMELVTRDRTSVPISSRVLTAKWPGSVEFLRSGPNVQGRQSPSAVQHSQSSAGGNQQQQQQQQHPSDSLLPAEQRRRSLYLPSSHAAVQALAFFLYTDGLPRAPASGTASSLMGEILLLLDSLDPGRTDGPFRRLRRLCRERLHAELTPESAPSIYELGTLTGQTGLQVRALKTMSESTRQDSPAPV